MVARSQVKHINEALGLKTSKEHFEGSKEPTAGDVVFVFEWQLRENKSKVTL